MTLQTQIKDLEPLSFPTKDFLKKSVQQFSYNQDKLIALSAEDILFCYVVLPREIIPDEWLIQKGGADHLCFLNIPNGISYIDEIEGDKVVFGFAAALRQNDSTLKNFQLAEEAVDQMKEQILLYLANYDQWKEAPLEGKISLMQNIYDQGKNKYPHNKLMCLLVALGDLEREKRLLEAEEPIDD